MRKRRKHHHRRISSCPAAGGLQAASGDEANLAAAGRQQDDPVPAAHAHQGRLGAAHTQGPVDPDRRPGPSDRADTGADLRALSLSHVQHALPGAHTHTDTHTRADIHTYDPEQRQGHHEGDQADTGENTVGSVRGRVADDGGDGRDGQEDRERFRLERRAQVCIVGPRFGLGWWD